MRSLRRTRRRWAIQQQTNLTTLGNSWTPRGQPSPLTLGPLHRPDTWWREISKLWASLDPYPPVRLLVTSACPGEGKSTTALGLAFHAVETLGLSTAILDLDLRRPRVLQTLNCEGGSPISDVLSERVRVAGAVHRHPSGLHALGSHVPAPESADMITAHGVGKLVSQLADRYEAVVVDSPPVVPAPEAVEIASGVGGATVIVANPDIASPEDLLHVERLLRGTCATLGVFFVVTDRRPDPS